ncbi:unnamed protein product, partial [Thlaspi arvense]
FFFFDKDENQIVCEKLNPFQEIIFLFHISRSKKDDQCFFKRNGYQKMTNSASSITVVMVNSSRHDPRINPKSEIWPRVNDEKKRSLEKDNKFSEKFLAMEYSLEGRLGLFRDKLRVLQTEPNQSLAVLFDCGASRTEQIQNFTKSFAVESDTNF